MAKDKSPKFVSVREASARLNLPEQRVRKLIRNGKLPVTRVGYNLVLNEADITKFGTESK